MHVRLALLAALAALSACAPRLLAGEPRALEVAVDGARLRILHGPEDAAAARRVAAALREAVPRVARWGGLPRPVTITLHPSQEALEERVGRPWGWLRGWARYQSVDLWSPRTWPRGPWLRRASDADVVELLAHELTHCAMFQRAGTDLTWANNRIPLWFLEGAASVTAGQARRRGDVRGLWRFYEGALPGAGDVAGARARIARARGNDGDPIGDPGPMVEERSDLVYKAAHHAFVFLERRYGEARVLEVLDRMGRGEGFAAAFEAVMGISDAQFQDEFRRYVVWQGWR